ncbi:MAG: peptidase S8 [Nitrosopumilus sp. B06]|nr:MAG: peptidase S8 [Nitrosopumilus sp. B06]
MRLVILATVIAVSLVLLYLQDDHIHTYLDRSVPYVGTGVPRDDRIDGTGVLVAVIDTGVDHTHPDLFGWGPDGKIVGGYNFVQQGILPIDTNGHGTQVAGVIAADGQAVGVAPGAGILAYKVSEDGEGVSSDLIVRAVRMAVEDGADIINISLGVNKTNEKIDRVVRYALDQGVFVVVAAGNDGPEYGSIGSPGGSYGAVTVGATYNNLTSSLVATLTVGERQYTVIPMVGSPKLEEPTSGRIALGGYGRPGEIADAAGAILVVERGSDIQGELLYFSAKEQNAAAAGARALVVYNNEPGIFLGELLHEFSGPEYLPQIPVVSMDREEGIELAGSAGSDASVHLFYNPDFAAHFSSRGPVSPFYIKPDIMAPGAFINTTQYGASYNFTSGTSYAAPHVAGAAALLLQKNPELTVSDLRSILLTTAQPVSDAYGDKFPIHAAGSGRLDVAAAYNADLIITPPSFVASISPQAETAMVKLELRPTGKLGNLGVSFDAPGLDIKYRLEKDILHLNITNSDYGLYEARLHITHNTNQYVVPFLIHHTPGSVRAEQIQDRIVFDINHPDGWSFAKISVTDSRDGKTRTVTAVPGESPSLQIYGNSEYWAEARIRTGDSASGAFEAIHITSLSESYPPLVEIAARPAAILVGIVALVGVTGMLWGRR